MSKALAVANGQQVVRGTFPDPMQLGPVFAQSGMFKDATDPAKAIVKIIAGQELGLGPMASMTGIHMIEGKPTLSANLLATQVKRHPAYDYKVREHTESACSIEFLQNGEVVGTSDFTHEDAVKAGVANKQNYKRYPKAMMFARALSQGVRWYCPDVTAGTPAYVPEELGAEVNEDGEPVDVVVVPNEAAETPVEATEASVIPPERAEAIQGRIAAQKMNYKEIGLVLGAVGIDGLRANSAQAITERLAVLTPGEATALEQALAS